MTRVFVDTNVLFPFSIMDVMLALTEDSVHEVLWTQTLLAEWERVIVREQRRSAASAAAITAAIREYFADSEVPESAYTHLIPQMPGDDPDDRPSRNGYRRAWPTGDEADGAPPGGQGILLAADDDASQRWFIDLAQSQALIRLMRAATRSAAHALPLPPTFGTHGNHGKP
ncbi:MAG TPA: hypothetical protein VFX60_16955 [Micromonospora sp.]|nr:hypothetical protein [Micromonospora sp.]